MQKRTLNDWQKLIEQQQTSGLSIVAICKENMLPTSNFYKLMVYLENGQLNIDNNRAERAIKPFVIV